MVRPTLRCTGKVCVTSALSVDLYSFTDLVLLAEAVMIWRLELPSEWDIGSYEWLCCWEMERR